MLSDMVSNWNVRAGCRRRPAKYAAAASQVSGKARYVPEGMEQKEEKYAAAKRKTGGDADRASE